MLLTTLTLSGTILASITVAGLLMLYQIRQTSNSENSAKAIFSADTALEYDLYRTFQPDFGCTYPAPEMTNGSTYTETMEINEDGDLVITGVGEANNVQRAFRLNLGAFSETVPCSE